MLTFRTNLPASPGWRGSFAEANLLTSGVKNMEKPDSG